MILDYRFYFISLFLLFPSNLMTRYVRCLCMMHLCVYIYVHKYCYVIFLKICSGAWGLLFCAGCIGRASQCVCPSAGKELAQWLWNKRWQKPESCKYKIHVVHKLYRTQFALNFLTSIYSQEKKKKRNKNLSILMEALSLRYLLFSVLSRCKDCIKYFPLLSIPKLFINQRFYVLSC